MLVNKLYTGCFLACAWGNEQRHIYIYIKDVREHYDILSNTFSFSFLHWRHRFMFSCEFVLQRYSPSPCKDILSSGKVFVINELKKSVMIISPIPVLRCRLMLPHLPT